MYREKNIYEIFEYYIKMTYNMFTYKSELVRKFVYNITL